MARHLAVALACVLSASALFAQSSTHPPALPAPTAPPAPPAQADRGLVVRVRVLVEDGRVPDGGRLNDELDALGARLVPLPCGQDRALAARVGLTSWYAVRWQGRESAETVRGRWLGLYRGIFDEVDVDQPGGVAGWPDPHFPGQWGLRNSGKLPDTLPDHDIDADAGWRLLEVLAKAGYALHPVRFALIDDGYAPTPHAPAWANRDMPPAVTGWNVVQGVPTNTHSGCGAGHGTHVASIAVAYAGNGYGMAGVCIAPVTIDPINVLNSSCWGVSTSCAEGMQRAADRGAHVANMSLQYSPPHSAYFRASAAYAHGRGTVLVAATGNWFGQPAAGPAAFKEVIGVNASTRKGMRAQFSNTGGDVGAPGQGILGLVNSGDYQAWDGTSMAAPHVAGIALTVRSLNPALNPDEVRGVIDTAAGRWPLWTVHDGFGMPSLYGAVMRAIPAYPDFNRDGSIDVADLAAFQAAFAARDERANCDASLDDEDLPTFDALDLVCFQARYALGR